MLKSSWTKADDTLFATLVGRRGRAHYHLVVERLPTENGWDWTVWRVGERPGLCQHGCAPAVATALAAAEGAAHYWDTRVADGSNAGALMDCEYRASEMS